MLLRSLQRHTIDLSYQKESFSNIIKDQEKEREIKIFSLYETMPTLFLDILPIGLVSAAPFSITLL